MIVPVLVAVPLLVWRIARAAQSRLRADSRVAVGIRDARIALSSASRQPKRLALLLAATAGVKATNLLALLAATWAFDGDLADWRVAVVYLVGVPVAEAIPTPGGIGGVDAVLVAGLARIGTSPAGAVIAAVIVFRLLTFWAPIVPGMISAASYGANTPYDCCHARPISSAPHPRRCVTTAAAAAAVVGVLSGTSASSTAGTPRALVANSSAPVDGSPTPIASASAPSQSASLPSAPAVARHRRFRLRWFRLRSRRPRPPRQCRPCMGGGRRCR